MDADALERRDILFVSRARMDVRDRSAGSTSVARELEEPIEMQLLRRPRRACAESLGDTDPPGRPRRPPKLFHRPSCKFSGFRNAFPMAELTPIGRGHEFIICTLLSATLRSACASRGAFMAAQALGEIDHARSPSIIDHPCCSLARARGSVG